MIMEEKIVAKLRAEHLSIACAESCTGGMVASRLINVAGASEVLEMSFVTYSDRAKHRLLGVSDETLKTYSAVSMQTAGEMAQGMAKAAQSDVAVSVTGLAGPDGGTEELPVGTVFIGVFYRGETTVKKFVFQGDRMQVREQAAQKALESVWERL
ncbi:MAG: CinA family protein [Lachnospiraceae bacterium]|nr:CinA family protein [Lachnospiraceae bacterium]